MRFFQQPLPDNHMVVIELVRILEQDAALAADCRRAARFYGQLTNPLARLTIADLAGSDLTSKQALARLRAEKGVKLGGSALFPPSTSRENELFARLFPRGTPTGSNLMKELVLAIRSGKVDLTPRPESGWYDHQVYALETLLMPERGEERHKLLLTKPYKKRMLEAFQALITTRRETHARELFGETTASVKVPDEFAPRLRLEPCPSYYLRTARSYDFLHDFLTTEVGPTALKELHGLHSDGERGRDLLTELEWMRQLFYGFYLVSCDDIGLAPQLAEGEAGNELDRVACYASAEEWLRQVADELDLAEDTRVAIPIYVDPARGTSRLWVTLGVRLTKLQADYVKPPRIKPAEGEGDWQVVEGWQLAPSNYLIAVDEFAEVEARALEPPNREELRQLCDEHQTKEKILAALAEGGW
jgi:hypothetical protein